MWSFYGAFSGRWRGICSCNVRTSLLKYLNNFYREEVLGNDAVYMAYPELTEQDFVPRKGLKLAEKLEVKIFDQVNRFFPPLNMSFNLDASRNRTLFFKIRTRKKRC